jgi:predicted nuclease of predicted toxin-antitoxin system
LKFLVDEMYPPTIAEQLRARGHDVAAVTERAELRALPDDSIFAAAQQEQRAVVTENIGDFSSLADAADQRGLPHHGLILVDPAKYPRGNPRTIGRLVTELDRLLHDHRSDEPTSLRWWL